MTHKKIPTYLTDEQRQVMMEIPTDLSREALSVVDFGRPRFFSSSLWYFATIDCSHPYRPLAFSRDKWRDRSYFLFYVDSSNDPGMFELSQT